MLSARFAHQSHANVCFYGFKKETLVYQLSLSINYNDCLFIMLPIRELFLCPKERKEGSVETPP
jgi:hypothetical protein